MNRSRILITGGSGFVGRHLVPLLLAQNYSVDIVDISPPPFSNINFIKTDISNEKVIAPHLEKADAVIHMAAMTGVAHCDDNPEELRRVNYNDTKKFIDLCKEKQVKHFVFTSSSEIYGDSADIPYHENGQPEPVSEYAKYKLDIEKYLQTLSGTMSTRIARFFNVYGPGQKENFVTSIFINAALRDEPLTIFGDGKQSRCFTYVGDAVEGVRRLLEDRTPSYDIFNIGNTEEMTINDLAHEITRLIPGSRSEIQYRDYDTEGVRKTSREIFRRIPSTDKALKRLNFQPSTSTHDGLFLTIQYYAQQNKKEHKIATDT